MKRTIALLAMALVMLLVLASAVPAVIRPLAEPIGPTGGTGEGEDGDHPWGGDRVIGSSGSPSTRVVLTTAVTGYPTVDLFVIGVLNYFVPQENKRDDPSGSLNISARARYPFSLSREAQR